MRYLKILSLAAFAAAMLAAAMAPAAAATVICSTSGSPCSAGQTWPSTVLDWSLKAEARFSNTASEPLDTCSGSTMKGTLFNGNATATAEVGISASELTWSSCSFPTTTLGGGRLEIHQTGTSDGTVTGFEIEVTINTLLFGSCVYTLGEKGTHMGTITSGSPAVFTVNALVKRGPGSNVVCPETGKWTATYKLTAPPSTALFVASS